MSIKKILLLFALMIKVNAHVVKLKISFDFDSYSNSHSYSNICIDFGKINNEQDIKNEINKYIDDDKNMNNVEFEFMSSESILEEFKDVIEETENNKKAVKKSFDKLKNRIKKDLKDYIFTHLLINDSYPYVHINKFSEEIPKIKTKSDIKEIRIYCKKRQKFDLIYDLSELIDDEKIKEEVLSRHSSCTKSVKEKVKKNLNCNIKKQLEIEFNDLKKFFSSENSFMITDNFSARYELKSEYEYYKVTSFKHQLGYLYILVYIGNKVKVYFDDAYVKKYNYKVVIKNTKGQRLNDDNTIYNSRKDIFEKSLDGIILKESCDGCRYDREIFEGKTKDDMCYFIDNICKMEEDKDNKILTITINEDREEYSNIVINNNSGKGIKKCTFFYRMPKSYIINHMKIGHENEGFLNGLKYSKNGRICNGTYELTVRSKKEIEEEEKRKRQEELEKNSIILQEKKCCCNCCR